jgi:hypothetical protein
MKLGYWDWKNKIQILLARNITSMQETELLWELYDNGFSTAMVYDYFIGASGIIRSGYRGHICGSYYIITEVYAIR